MILNQIRIEFLSKNSKGNWKMHCSHVLTAAHGHICPGRPGPWRQDTVAHDHHTRACLARVARCGARWLIGGSNPKSVTEKQTGEHGHRAATPKAGREWWEGDPHQSEAWLGGGAWSWGGQVAWRGRSPPSLVLQLHNNGTSMRNIEEERTGE
jgi:hypothetical protein